MPALSPTMTEGKIVKWNIQEGEKIDVGDVICEIMTDKATIGFESQEEGYLAKILRPEGSSSEIGSLIGVMVEEKDDIANVDLSGVNVASETKAEKVVTPKAVVADDNNKKVASSPGSEDFFDELEKMLHDG